MCKPNLNKKMFIWYIFEHLANFWVWNLLGLNWGRRSRVICALCLTSGRAWPSVCWSFQFWWSCATLLIIGDRCFGAHSTLGRVWIHSGLICQIFCSRHLFMYETVYSGLMEVHLPLDILSCTRFEEVWLIVEVYSSYIMCDNLKIKVRWLVRSQGFHMLKYIWWSKRPCRPCGKGQTPNNGVV